MNAPFASGSNPPDVMVVIPCTMGTMGRIAHGFSEDLLLRAADVVLKEKKKLILVPRETPLSLVHVKNMELLLLAGATILPANPSFYSGAQTAQQIADTVVARVLDHVGVANTLAPRWAKRGNDMKNVKNEHSTFNIQHSTPKDSERRFGSSMTGPGKQPKI